MLKTHVCGILFESTKKMSMDTLRSDELQAFIDLSSGMIDKSKSPYLAILPDVYDGVSRLSAVHTGSVEVGSFPFDGWSKKCDS